MAINYRQLSVIVDQCLDTYVSILLKDVQGKRIYSLGLYTSNEFTYLAPTANTIDFLHKSKRTASPTGYSLKWSVADWEYHNWRDDIFSPVEECLVNGWDENFEEYTNDSEEFVRIGVESLKNLRDRHFQDTEVLVSLFLPSVGHEVSKMAAVEINPSCISGVYLDDLLQLYRV